MTDIFLADPWSDDPNRHEFATERNVRRAAELAATLWNPHALRAATR